MIDVLKTLRRGRLKATHYDKGWVPGPNADWRKRSPGDMAKGLSAHKSSNPVGKSSPASVPSENAQSKASPEKPNRVRDRANEPKVSLREVVKKFGGINLASLEASGFDVKHLMESGLQYRGLFRRGGGVDIAQMASQLHSNGDIQIPGVEQHGEKSKTLPKEAGQYLMDQLLAKAKSLHATKEAEYKKSYQAYMQEMKNAEANGPEAAQALRDGEADGQAEGAGDDAFDDDSAADEAGTSEVGDFDPSKFQHGRRYNKGWEPGPDAHWAKKSPDEMARSLPKNKAPNELVSNKTKEKIAGPGEQEASNLAGKSPDELASHFKPKGEQEKPAEAAAPVAAKNPVSPEEARHLFDSQPRDKATGLPEFIAREVAAQMKQFPGSDFDALLSEAALAAWGASQDTEKGREAEYPALAKTAIRNSFKNLNRGATAKKRGEGKVGQMPDGADVGKQDRINKSDFEESIGHLNPKAQKIARMVMYEDMSQDQIAEALGTNKTDVNRTIKALGSVFKDYMQKNGRKFRYMNENHVPAGSSEGGQFTGGEGQSPDEMVSKLSGDKTPKNTPASSLSELAQGGSEKLTPESIDKAASELASMSGADVKSAIMAAFGEKHGKAIITIGKSKQGIIDKAIANLKENLASYESTKPGFTGYENSGDHDRYSAPIRPDVWSEILSQAKTFGPNGPEFIRSVMEAMKGSDSQWDAILKGRQAFLSHGSQRYEYGPRHSPPKRIDGAVARLEALAEYAGEIDDEAIEDEVVGIAREFSAADLKEIARKFGVKGGINTKAKTLDKLLAKVCEDK